MHSIRASVDSVGVGIDFMSHSRPTATVFYWLRSLCEILSVCRFSFFLSLRDTLTLSLSAVSFTGHGGDNKCDRMRCCIAVVYFGNVDGVVVSRFVV